MSGHSPFEAETEEETFKRILHGVEKLKMEDRWKPEAQDVPAWDFFRQCCRKSAHDRLPMRQGGLGNVLQHAMYHDFDWESLEEGKMVNV